MTTGDLHTLTGAYAVGAIAEPEAGEFRRHLSECEACAQEVRELQETAARLALAVAEVPPAAMRERVMAALPGVRQLPPDVPAPRVAEVPLAAPRRRGWRQRMPALAAAACLVAAVVATGLAVDARQDADAQRGRTARAEQQAAELSVLTAAPDATFHSGVLTGGGTATLVASKRLEQAAVLYHGLPALPGGRVYELWYSRGGGMVRAGLVEPGRTAGAEVLDGAPADADGVGITAEPRGGSRAPTSPPLALLPL
ncbi:anti-sigma factor [Streptomyces cocklensis]|uniref:Regulator of SigK n=1 Tax=Actinacidiphila cocklensis TaxID=887465 RepID=A0A9W4GUJ6_9ACTN|nr:anti-sigma factor [Actinacidiphila cocklensis]MDD1059407.1 anti-sigma factor [Actinacidiphila cocklensis]WSX76189.1 anti-sigma factor [Streptomyces sp. NBC_00899]CAG6398219.1 Anti-sigma-K factor rskA [Actinacidiphila cocklensis]